MAGTGLCSASLEDPKALMKMGLSMVLIGHVNFMLGALVHGVVLRHINLHKQARAMEYAISNICALTSGLVGIVIGILAIILSKNKKSRSLTWSLFTFSLASALMAAASAIGLFVSAVKAIIHGGRSLLSHCRFPDAIGYSSITNECPFDPTRIYSTTLILWVPLIVTCVIQMVFSARCLAVCVSFLGLRYCPRRKRRRNYGKAVNAVTLIENTATSQHPAQVTYSRPASRYSEPPRSSSGPPSRYTEPPRSSSGPPSRYTEPPRSTSGPPSRYTEPPRSTSGPPSRYTEPPRSTSRPPSRYTEPPKSHFGSARSSTEPYRPRPLPNPQHLPREHRSLPPSERRPLHQQHRERSHRQRPETRVDGLKKAPEEHQLLERGTLERSSFWI